MAEQKSKASSSSKMITLKSRDDALFEVEPNIAKEMKIVQACIDEAGDIETIPISNVSGKHLAIVIEHIKKHSEEYEAEFMKQIKQWSDDDMKELLLAVNYLEVSCLRDCVRHAIADWIKNKSVEFIRMYFNVENDYSPEEEAKLRKEYAWAFEGVDKD